MRGQNVALSAIAVALISTGVLATPAIARDKPTPPPPCPLTGTLRIADGASIAGLQTLSRCDGNILAAPATPAEYVEPVDQRISPEERPAPPLRRTSAPISMADADSSENSGKVARIAPRQDEPVDLAEALPSLGSGASADGILAMRPVSYSTPYDQMITRVAVRHRIDPLLLHSVIKQESGYKVTATSRVGARGLMQLMPGTARMLGVTAVTDAESNVDGGARLLRRLNQRYGGDFNLTLAAYNAGEGAVHRYGNRVPPYAETQQYVRSVMANYSSLVAEQGVTGR